MARLLMLLSPMILMIVLIVVGVILYNWYQQGFFNPKSIMIQNPITGVYTRINLEDIHTIDITDEIESVLFYKDGTRLAIKTKDAQRLMRYMPTME